METLNTLSSTTIYVYRSIIYFLYSFFLDFSSDAVHLPWVEDPHLHAEEALHQGGIVVTPLHSDKCITYNCSSSFSEGPNIGG